MRDDVDVQGPKARADSPDRDRQFATAERLGDVHVCVRSEAVGPRRRHANQCHHQHADQ
jgi:hypothetical protein